MLLPGSGNNRLADNRVGKYWRLTGLYRAIHSKQLVNIVKVKNFVFGIKGQNKIVQAFFDGGKVIP